MMTVSTLHIRETTAAYLNREPEEIVLFPKAEYGWFIYTGNLSAKERGVLPDELGDLIKTAQDLGCDWLCVDRDWPVEDSLKTFEWD
ncbi:hypothetical protein IMZ31_22305 (plasmid) [Pontibacillus sp. ALD_SL1]|uniref:DUF5983 family protein n=1 Tax=Pontibacillus sp. ALD_SL1 TaxID=2777185 RepID=UPI001A96060C|nr:hypothetical protein [Pontibacillus sp. ALD_SL1]QST02188.1 hypothetical protein IMZ31_22305 [Pontibacillus sp. ALD_SL1]